MDLLTTTIEVNVRFSEVDSIHFAWHGSYVKYMEDGREAFGREYGLEYMHMFDSGYIAPIVDMHLQYKQPVTVGDTILIETSYVPDKAAKLIFEYRIYKKSDMSLVLQASTIQLFMTKDGIFEVSNPDFFSTWKQRWGMN
jgi:acyl-CoA thioester hydrolase